jgi:hypothetical protein
VEAKGDPANDARLAKLDKKEVELEQEHMMQVLLAERFKLKVHWATKEGDVYNLVVVKAVRLQSTGAPPSAEELKNWGDHPISPLYQHGSSDHGFEYTAHGASVCSTRSIRTISFGVCASGDWKEGVPPGMVQVVAVRGGRGPCDASAPARETKTFLVPKADYGARGPHGFVVDPDVYAEVISTSIQ